MKYRIAFVFIAIVAFAVNVVHADEKPVREDVVILTKKIGGNAELVMTQSPNIERADLARMFGESILPTDTKWMFWRHLLLKMPGSNPIVLWSSLFRGNGGGLFWEHDTLDMLVTPKGIVIIVTDGPLLLAYRVDPVRAHTEMCLIPNGWSLAAAKAPLDRRGIRVDLSLSGPDDQVQAVVTDLRFKGEEMKKTVFVEQKGKWEFALKE